MTLKSSCNSPIRLACASQGVETGCCTTLRKSGRSAYDPGNCPQFAITWEHESRKISGASGLFTSTPNVPELEQIKPPDAPSCMFSLLRGFRQGLDDRRDIEVDAIGQRGSPHPENVIAREPVTET